MGAAGESIGRAHDSRNTRRESCVDCASTRTPIRPSTNASTRGSRTLPCRNLDVLLSGVYGPLDEDRRRNNTTGVDQAKGGGRLGGNSPRCMGVGVAGDIGCGLLPTVLPGWVRLCPAFVSGGTRGSHRHGVPPPRRTGRRLGAFTCPGASLREGTDETSTRRLRAISVDDVQGVRELSARDVEATDAVLPGLHLLQDLVLAMAWWFRSSSGQIELILSLLFS